MKTLEDLKKLRDQSLKNMEMRNIVRGTRIQIGMGTCGVAAGARPVLAKFVEEIAEHNLNNVVITQVGCMGECAFEPIVEIIEHDGTRTVYCKVNERMVGEIVEEHLINGKRCNSYLLSAIKR
jgi:NADP-reducing hydrogenase subunit HndB